VSVCFSLVTQHAMRIHPIVLLSVACRLFQHFSTLSQKTARFSGKSCWPWNWFVFIFSSNLS